jgi:hypothetical protein
MSIAHVLDIKKCIDPKLSFYDSAELVNADHWNKVIGDKSVFLSLEYLRALENALQSEMQFRYIIYYNNVFIPVAVAYIQLIHFVDIGLKYKDILCKVGDKIKNKLLQSIDVKVLLCGNVFACGETGFAYTENISPKETFLLIAGSMKRIIEDEEKNGQISFSLFKEFWPASFKESDNLKKSSYRDFMIDVNMVMQLPATWNNMDDYLAAMTTKFRTKAKGVYKKSKILTIVEFDTADIENHKNRIEELYNAVHASAEYKFGQLNGQAFINFKKNLKEKFIFKGYFLEKKLIGFSSVFHSADITDANYVGLDYDYNKEYAVYQRMLYDFVELSILLKANELRLGRTAELIKSSIGAEPVNMKLYAKHRNSISNKLLGPIISNISPGEYEIRPPFKMTPL